MYDRGETLPAFRNQLQKKFSKIEWEDAFTSFFFVFRQLPVRFFIFFLQSIPERMEHFNPGRT